MDTTLKFKIEKGIPLPKWNCHHYPFNELLHVGDSFLIPVDGNMEKQKMQIRLASAANHYLAYHKLTWKYKTHQVEDGVRIWRVK